MGCLRVNCFSIGLEIGHTIILLVHFFAEDSGVMIVGCLAENWREEDTKETNLVRVGTCLKCLEEVGFLCSETNSPGFYHFCVRQFM